VHVSVSVLSPSFVSGASPEVNTKYVADILCA
jgi:hypothetical protein